MRVGTLGHAALALTRLWDLPVIVSPVMPVGTAPLAASPTARTSCSART
jgi:hypothetical protein